METVVLIARAIIVLLGIASITYLGLRTSIDFSASLKEWIGFFIQFAVIVGGVAIVWNAEPIAYHLYPYLHFDAELLFYVLVLMVFLLSIALTSTVSVLNRD